MAPKAKSFARAAMAEASSVQAEAVAAEPEEVITANNAYELFKEFKKNKSTEQTNLKRWNALVTYTNEQKTPVYKNKNVDKLNGVLEMYPSRKAKIEAVPAKQVPTKVTLSKEVVGKADYNQKRAANVKVRAEGKKSLQNNED